MLKLIRYLKPFVFSIILVVALLFVQASCDLAMPDRMAKIVDEGIQQGGIPDAVPTSIRKSEFERLTFFMKSGDAVKAIDSYKLKDSSGEDDPVLELKAVPADIRAELSSVFGRAIMIVGYIEKNNAETAPAVQAAQLEELKAMDAQQKDSFLENIYSQLPELPESIIVQSAIPYIKNEYNALGIDTDKLQLNSLLFSGFRMLLLTLLSMLATVMVGLIAARIAAALSRDLRRDTFRKVESFSGEEFDKFSTASLITRTTNDIQQIQLLLVMLLRFVFYAPILGIGGVLKVVNTHTGMGWIIGVGVGSILTIVMVLFVVAVPKFKRIQTLVDRLNLVTREILSGLPVIRAFNTQKHEEKKFDKANVDFTQNNLFVNRVMVLMMPLMMFIMNGVTLLIIWVGAHKIEDGVMQVGNLMAFMQYSMQIIMAMLMLTMVSVMLPRAAVSAGRISEVLSTKPSIIDPPVPVDFDNKYNGVVEFKNVSFFYPHAEECALEDISFTAKAGETTAFIGSTGSGKSTLINLIPRFYDVSSGQVMVSGADVREVTQETLRDKIGYVPQKGVLFSGTIESNLKYGKENATGAELEKAADTAQASQFISEKPDGYDSGISEGGHNVSGGQKQRLSIARALVKKPEIFIFDDSFSALDFKTDAALRHALASETNGATLLIVAQRISTIKNAQQIIVLDSGKMVGKGTHDELMKDCEVYREIAFSQLSKEELA